MGNDRGDHWIGDEIDDEIDDLLDRRAHRGDERGADAVFRAAKAGNIADEAPSLTPTSRLAVAAVLLVMAAIGVGLFTSLTGNDSGLVITQTPGDTPASESEGERSPPLDEPIVAPTDEDQPETGGVDGASSPGGDAQVPNGQEPDAQTGAEEANSQDIDPPGTGGDGDDSSLATDDAGAMTTPSAPSSGSGPDAITDWVIYEPVGSVESARSEPNGTGWIDYITPGPEAGANGGLIRRATKPHRFIDGRLVIEVDYAATVDGRGDSAWGEVVVSASDRPTLGVDGGFYAAQFLPGEAALGCRLQSDRQVVCQLFDPDGERIWQMSWFEAAGQQETVNADPGSWRVCAAGGPGMECLNRFRLELTADEVLVTVNGETVLHQSAVPGIPSTLVDGEGYVYASSLLSRHDEATARFDWGPVRVNPGP